MWWGRTANDILLRQAHPITNKPRIINQIIMRQHCRFRASSRARGELQVHEVGGLDLAFGCGEKAFDVGAVGCAEEGGVGFCV